MAGLPLAYREDLDDRIQPCACGGHAVTLAPPCHPEAPTMQVRYDRGVLCLFCPVCGGPALAVKVAVRGYPAVQPASSSVV